MKAITSKKRGKYIQKLLNFINGGVNKITKLFKALLAKTKYVGAFGFIIYDIVSMIIKYPILGFFIKVEKLYKLLEYNSKYSKVGIKLREKTSKEFEGVIKFVDSFKGQNPLKLFVTTIVKIAWFSIKTLGSQFFSMLTAKSNKSIEEKLKIRRTKRFGSSIRFYWKNSIYAIYFYQKYFGYD